MRAGNVRGLPERRFRHHREEPNFGYLRDLAVSFNKTGDARACPEDEPAALADYEAGPQNHDVPGGQPTGRYWLPARSRRQPRKMGLALRLNGDLDASLEHYRKALDISERLAAAAPDDLELQRDLTVGLNAIGAPQAPEGDHSGALEPYGRSVAICEHWCARSGEHALATRPVRGPKQAWRCPGVDRQPAGSPRRLPLRARPVAASRRAGLDPSNAEWQRDLAVGP